MTECIDRTVLLNHLKNCKGQPPEMRYTFAVIQAIESFVKDSPAADVVEVVRCQNCAYSHKGCDSDMTKEIWCTYWQKTEGKAWNMMHFDDFCSHGAKMDLEEHHESNYL